MSRGRFRLAVVFALMVPAVIVVGPGHAADDSPPALSLSLSAPHLARVGGPLHVSVTARETVRLHLDLVDDAGVVARLADGIARRGVPFAFEWNGSLSDGRAAPDGSYRLVVFASDAAGNPTQTSAPFLVDRGGPSIAWGRTSPEPLSNQAAIAFRFRLWDSSPELSVSYAVFGVGGLVDRREGIAYARGDGVLRWTAASHSGVPAGTGVYRIRIVVADPSGNRSSAVQAFRIHRPGKPRIVHRVDGVRGMVALTFDDGVSGGAWARIVHILARRKAHATFFCNGTRVGQFPSAARRALLGGNSIGSHTYDHARLTNLRTRAIASELLRDEKEWWQFRADPVPYFRPPYGAYDARVLAVAGRLGFRYVVLWDVDPGDWKRPGASVIARRVVSGARAGSIVIMHVLPQTADALGPMITGLARKGLRPVGLDELFAAAR